MKTLILSLFLLSNSHVLFGQGVWTQLSSYPGSGKHHICSFVIGDSAYLVTGSGSADFYKYEIHADSWEQLADFPGGERNFAIGFSINGKGYVSCGYDGNSTLMDMWEFDATTRTWSQKSSGPAMGRAHPAFSVVGDRVYIGQGQAGSSWIDIADWYEYNTITDSWTQKSNLMGARHHGCGATIGNKIYVGTGHHQQVMYDDWYEYDASTDTWTQKANFTGNGRSAGNSVARNGKVYLFAGEDEIDFERFDDFREYDPVLDSWTTLTEFPAGGRWAPFMFIHNDTIYAGAGEDGSYQLKNDLWRYDFQESNVAIEDLPSLDNISIYPNPSAHLVYISAESEGVYSGAVYALNGKLMQGVEFLGKNYTLDVSEFDPGVYLIKIMTNRGQMISRFVKN